MIIKSRYVGTGMAYIHQLTYSIAPYYGMTRGSMPRRKLTKIQNPAFGQIHLREMTEIFVSKSTEVSTDDSKQDNAETSDSYGIHWIS